MLWTGPFLLTAWEEGLGKSLEKILFLKLKVEEIAKKASKPKTATIIKTGIAPV